MTNLAHPIFSLRQLQYAVAVADALSFSKAAARCHVSQPSLSAQLAQLEGALGVRLFERNRRRVLLTSAGGQLIEGARRVLAEAASLAVSAREASDPLAGTLRIGVIPTIAAYLLPSASRALRAAYPQLSVRWVEDKTSTLMRSLEAGTLECALVALEADLGTVEHERVAWDPFVIAAPPNHPVSKSRAPASAADLRGAQVLLLDEGHCFREQALAFCTKVKARELEFRATSLATLAQMVASGAGITLLPSLSVETECRRAELTIRPFADPSPLRTIVLAWRRRSPMAESLRRVARTLRESYPVGSTARRSQGSLRGEPLA